jgi:uncharacterized protein (DUF2252 family)
MKSNIPRGSRFWSLSKQEAAAIPQLFKREDVRKLVTSLKSRPEDGVVEALDAAFWVKGSSSLGHARYAVLFDVSRNKESKRDEYCLADVKEATPAAAPRAAAAQMPRNTGKAGGCGRAQPVAGPGRSHDGIELPGTFGGAARTDAPGPEPRD